MEKPLTVSTHGIDLPASTRALIEERATQLERYYPALIGCSVLVQGPGDHHRNGGPFSIQIDLRVPGGDPIVVSRQTAPDLPGALGESFDAARRRLEAFARLQRGR